MRLLPPQRVADDATGITVLQHSEWDGGQDVFHLHVHVVPRHAGDGFYHGVDRWPHGLEVVSSEERRLQAAAVARHLDAADPPHPVDVYRSDGERPSG